MEGKMLKMAETEGFEPPEAPIIEAPKEWVKTP